MLEIIAKIRNHFYYDAFLLVYKFTVIVWFVFGRCHARMTFLTSIE